jgi:CRISPR-associated protein Cmr6
MAIPLYEQTRWDERLSQPLPGANPGLLFDKFAAGWNEQWGQLGNDEKRDFLKKVIQYVGDSTDSIQAALKQAHQQRAKLIDFLQGDSKDFQTEWRFVSGLGSSHPFETGFIWHRTLGVPYLPGSSVKGMMRAWASQWMDDCEDTVHIERINRLFGPETTSAESGNVGAFVVLDALPTDPPELELDILNPHYQPYYSDPLTHYPADYYSPVPVFFLAVAAEQSFRFALAPRPGVQMAQTDREWLWGILGDALQYIGAGGKTAAGYGEFNEIIGPDAPPPNVPEGETAVWLKQFNDLALLFVAQNGQEYSRLVSHCQFKKDKLQEGRWYILRGERAVHLPRK